MSKRAAGVSKADGEAEVLAKIAAMPESWRSVAERVHAVISRSGPALQPRVWYGMPGYTRNGKTVCFFRADKHYMTFGVTQEAGLTAEEGAPHQLIPSAWYFTSLDEATEVELAAIVGRLLADATSGRTPEPKNSDEGDE